MKWISVAAGTMLLMSSISGVAACDTDLSRLVAVAGRPLQKAR